MSQADITLVNISTAVPCGEGGKREAYLPLGCLYLVGALERAGLGVEFRDYQLRSLEVENPLNVDSLITFIDDSARVLGISCMVSMLPFVLLATKRFKELHPERTIVLGGPGPSGVAEAIMRSMPWIDVVARGEGEETIVELVRALRERAGLASIGGITYREGPAVRHTPSRKRIRNLDELGFPAYSRVEVGAYENISIVSGRGCPYRCAFCDVGPLWENKTVFRGMENVIAELRLLKEIYGLSRVHIADDTFDLRRDRAERFCAEVAGLGIDWTCLSRIDLLDEKLLETMAKAGCDAIFLGIESGSDAVLRRINKRFTIEEATEKVSLSTGFIPKVVTSFIWGFPFETMDDFKSTVFSVVSMWHLGAMAGLKLLSPMPLSPLGGEYADRLRFDEDLCSVFASLGNVEDKNGARGGGIPEEFIAIIKEFPDIFAGFYHIQHEGLREKASYLKGFSEKRGIRI
jgi:anaerobic magnesium-protoporphyrin IX monomethyl ester cyclase